MTIHRSRKKNQTPSSPNAPSKRSQKQRHTYGTRRRQNTPAKHGIGRTRHRVLSNPNPTTRNLHRPNLSIAIKTQRSKRNSRVFPKNPFPVLSLHSSHNKRTVHHPTTHGSTN